MNLMPQQVACDKQRVSQQLVLQATESGGQEEITFLPTRFEQQERLNTTMLGWLILMLVVLIGLGILRLRLKQSRKETPQEEARRILTEYRYRHDSSWW